MKERWRDKLYTYILGPYAGGTLSVISYYGSKAYVTTNYFKTSHLHPTYVTAH